VSAIPIPDRWLRRALEEVLGKPFTPERLATLRRLDWSEYRAEAELPWSPIEDIGPLRYCINLQVLSFDGNAVEDLSPLAACGQLEEIWLVQNQVRDLSPLKGCTGLRKLVVSMNYRLDDINALRGLPSLEYLNIAQTQVRDITPLLDLPALQEVTLYDLRLDLTPGSEDHQVLAELVRRGVQIGYRGIEAVIQAVQAEQASQLAEEASLPERLKALGAFKLVRLIEAVGINARDEAGNTPLHLAARPSLEELIGADPISDRVQTVRLLLVAEGIEVDARNNDGSTPLNYMLNGYREADIEIVRMLLDAGADPNTLSGGKLSPLPSAVGMDREDIVDLLVERGAESTTPRVFNAYCESGTIERVREAIADGYDVNTREEWLDRPPLHAAALKNQVEIAVLLLERGANVHAMDAVGRTALHNAHEPQAVRALLEAGADVHVADNQGRTPIFDLAYCVYPESARLLIAHGADVNHRDQHGNTPLHVCRYEGWKGEASFEMIDLLVQHGADVNALNEQSKTPMDCYRQPEMRKRIQKHGGMCGQTVIKRRQQEA
jgi:ankyrin repeat protein